MKRFVLVTMVLLLCGWSLAQADDQWESWVGIDNSLTIYYGTSTHINEYVGTCVWHNECYSVTTQPSNAYLYVATASDHSVAQGFVGKFKNITQGRTYLTGDPAWEVFPAGKYASDLGIDDPWPGGPGGTQPTQAQVDDAIAYATANNLWVTPTSVEGYDLDPTTTPPAPYEGYIYGDHWPNIWSPGDPGQAQWIWYESGDVLSGGFHDLWTPFNGGNHQEFLVFRIAGDPESIPTLTEWGLIIFAVLLMGCMTWVVVRRRKGATVSI